MAHRTLDVERPLAFLDAFDRSALGELPPRSVAIDAAYVVDAFVCIGAVGLVDASDLYLLCHTCPLHWRGGGARIVRRSLRHPSDGNVALCVMGPISRPGRRV